MEDNILNIRTRSYQEFNSVQKKCLALGAEWASTGARELPCNRRLEETNVISLCFYKDKLTLLYNSMGDYLYTEQNWHDPNLIECDEFLAEDVDELLIKNLL